MIRNILKFRIFKNIFKMEEDLLTLENIKSHVTKVSTGAKITSFSAKYIGRDSQSSFKEKLLILRINPWPAHVFELEIDFDFSDIANEKFGVFFTEISFIENQL